MKIGPQRVHLGERELEGLGWDLNKKPHAHLATRKLQQVFRERFHRQSGSTKRIPKRVRVQVSRTSRTDEAAERG